MCFSPLFIIINRAGRRAGWAGGRGGEGPRTCLFIIFIYLYIRIFCSSPWRQRLKSAPPRWVRECSSPLPSYTPEFEADDGLEKKNGRCGGGEEDTSGVMSSCALAKKRERENKKYIKKSGFGKERITQLGERGGGGVVVKTCGEEEGKVKEIGGRGRERESARAQGKEEVVAQLRLTLMRSLCDGT